MFSFLSLALPVRHFPKLFYTTRSLNNLKMFKMKVHTVVLQDCFE